MDLFQRNGYVIFACLALFTLGCQTTSVSTTDGQTVQEMTEEEKIQNDIELLVDAMALPRQRLDTVCSRIIEYGEKAVPELSKNIENRLNNVRLLCIFCLGQIYEKTKSPTIKGLAPRLRSRLADPFERVRMEAAATLCTLEDYNGVHLLIDALRNESPYVRMVASQTLHQTFKVTFGYQYEEKNPEKREIAVKRWEEWWIENKGKYLTS